MSEEIYKPERRRPAPRDFDMHDTDDMKTLDALREQANMSRQVDSTPPPSFSNTPNLGVEIKGNVPPQFAAMMKGDNLQQPKNLSAKNKEQKVSSINRYGAPEDAHFKETIGRLSNHNYEMVQLPSKGKFYDGTDGPVDGVLYLRPMTGMEEQILATPRFVKKGKAIDMIFESCIQGKIDAGKLLSADRTYLLIYLRIISYTPSYEVEVKCPECSHKYPSDIDLNALDVEECPEDFDVNSLEAILPKSGFKVSYRLARGSDDIDMNNYRERKTKEWGDNATDDTLHYRTSMLINEIEGITQKVQIQQILKKLPISDLSYLRDVSNNPPFGVDTDVNMLCPTCFAEYTVDLPLEANFFFPRRKKM